jgi:hypothetical protein
METVGSQKVFAYDSSKKRIVKTTNGEIRKSKGIAAANFLEIVQIAAQLQFVNRDKSILFRGQSKDILNRTGYSSLKPNLYRSKAGPAKIPTLATMELRYAVLNDAQKALIEIYKKHNLLGRERIEKHELLRWAILQHYEVCFTPLLDVTQSLRMAVSMAYSDTDEFGYVYLLDAPPVSGGVSTQEDVGVQVIRLSSVCPPEAFRPHVQEGLLLGAFPIVAKMDMHSLYKYRDLDFGRRIVGKIRFKNSGIKADQNTFPTAPRQAMYPDEHDSMVGLLEDIKSECDERLGR